MRLHIGRFQVKKGWIVILVLAIGMIIFQYNICSAVIATIMLVKGEPVLCSPVQLLNAVGDWVTQRTRTDSLRATARLISSEPAGLKQYWIGTEGWWTPHGGLGYLPDILAEQERGIYDGVNARVQRGDIVLDIGAHVGVFAKHALKLGAALVVAVEPVPPTITCLERNLATDIRQGRVLVYPKGAWDRDDLLRMTLSTVDSGSDSFLHGADPTKQQVLLPLTTIDTIVRDLKLTKVDFIKMDIEGSERHALAGARETLRKWKPRMSVCVYHLDDDRTVIPNVIKSIRSDYKQESGYCIPFAGKILPEVYFYY
jgi:FkbM family methyltransferase